MDKLVEHIIPDPRFSIGQIVYDHWPEQYAECRHIKYVVTGIRFDHTTGKIDYQISPLHDVMDTPIMSMERTDGYHEEHLDIHPMVIVSKQRPSTDGSE